MPIRSVGHLPPTRPTRGRFSLPSAPRRPHDSGHPGDVTGCESRRPPRSEVATSVARSGRQGHAGPAQERRQPSDQAGRADEEQRGVHRYPEGAEGCSAALTPAQVAYGKSLDGLKASFTGLLAGKSGEALLGTVAQGMDLLSKTLPLTAPLLVSVGHGIG
jgi:hypothetical protein